MFESSSTLLVMKCFRCINLVLCFIQFQIVATKMLVSTWVLILTALAAASVAWLYWRKKNKHFLELSKLLPGPPTVPLLGHAYLFTNMGFLERITWLVRTYGEYVKFWMGPEFQIYISNPTDIRYILMSNKVNQKGRFYNVIKEALGGGLITGGPTWRLHRKITNPTYNRKLGPGFCDIFNQEGANLVRDLEKKDPHITFNILPNAIWSTTQCTLRALMGLTKQESLRVNKLQEVIDFTDDMYTLAFNKMTKWYLYIPFCVKLFGYKKYLDYYISTVQELGRDIIDIRRKHLTARNIRECDLQDEHGVVEGFGVVDRFILSDEFDEQEKIDETFTLFTASQEATGKVTGFVLFFLAHLPEWQEKVYNELMEEIGEERPLTENDLKKLIILDAVFKEVLRHMPIAACIQRETTEEITLEKSKITLPAGTPIILTIHAMHRDPKYWDQPDMAMPERFLTENNKKKEPEAYLPFSLGVMDCVGRMYAINLVKIISARVIWNYKLFAEGKIHELELDVAISTKFKNGCPLRVQRRRPAA